MITIGTRGSDLALVQARYVAARLTQAGYATRLEIISTRGDEAVHLSFDKIEGKGFFTKEIEQALLVKQVDVAVHSLKDLPTEPTPGLCVAAIPAREDARDCLLIRCEAHAPNAAVLPLALGARVGTSAARRKAQLLHLRSDVRVGELRGNVPTRVRRLREGRFDAVVLAQAGLTRLSLDLADLIQLPLPVAQFVPAPGQGALGLQTRVDDTTTQSALAPLHNASVAAAVAAERHVLACLEGGCHIPLGTHVFEDNGAMRLVAFWGESGQRLDLRGTDAHALAVEAFRKLRSL